VESNTARQIQIVRPGSLKHIGQIPGTAVLCVKRVHCRPGRFLDYLSRMRVRLRGAPNVTPGRTCILASLTEARIRAAKSTQKPYKLSDLRTGARLVCFPRHGLVGRHVEFVRLIRSVSASAYDAHSDHHRDCLLITHAESMP
jgi:hypothetical protein